MILAELATVTAYRMHTPRWAVAPTSGAGAAAHGGRANRVGVSALYLALEPETAVREYQQLSPLMPPGTLVSYTVRLTLVVDFRAGYEPKRWPALWEEFYCDWRELWFNQRVEPPSWVLADESLAAGIAAALGVTIDELFGVGKRRLAKQDGDSRLRRRLLAIEKLDVADKRQVLQLLDAFIERGQLKRKVESRA